MLSFFFIYWLSWKQRTSMITSKNKQWISLNPLNIFSSLITLQHFMVIIIFSFCLSPIEDRFFFLQYILIWFSPLPPLRRSFPPHIPIWIQLTLLNIWNYVLAAKWDITHLMAWELLKRQMMLTIGKDVQKVQAV